MSTKTWKSIRRTTPERLAEIQSQVRRELLEVNLKQLRRLLGKTQEEVAGVLEARQSHISQTESREDHMVSTLRAYVEALGGELEIVARFGKKSVRLTAV